MGAFFQCNYDSGTGEHILTRPVLTLVQHDAPVKYVGWITSANLLLTGSWDKTMRTWDCRSSSPGHTLPLPERLYCADTKANVIVAATAERKIVGFDIRNLGQVCTPDVPELTRFSQSYDLILPLNSKPEV